MTNETRRKLLSLGAAAAGVALTSCKHGEAEVTPGEDLMQEHGVLERIVIVYDTAAERIERGEQVDPAVVAQAAGIVRRFVEDYHERTEEKFVFPRLQAAGREATLVSILLKQHQRGRELTDELIRRAGIGASEELARALRSFSRMYRAHAAREDTVIFPAFREIVGGAEYEELGEQFEEREHQLVGEHGFERAVADVARLEAQLGIADLAAFTPA
ncbi:MAG TPA: hemerythrin domain-containing protein [Polyangiaceae bacterium]|nr:hemerythrin domain-containing protein [Polyangiaceae bacterium]